MGGDPVRRRFNRLALLGAALMIAGPLAISADAAVTKTYTRSAVYHLGTTLNLKGCGQQLAAEVETSLTLDTKNYTFFFSNAGMNHVASTSGDLSAVFSSVDGGLALRANSKGQTLPVGGNPWFFVAYTDGSGVYRAHLLGKCREILGNAGGVITDRTDLVEQLVDTVGVLGCQNHPGPYLDITAGTDGPGLKAVVFITNNKTKADAWASSGILDSGFHLADTDGYVTLEPTGGRLTVRKGGRIGNDTWGAQWGPGGNPHIWAFASDTLSAPTYPTLSVGGDGYVGRCNDTW
jgi:hypothetical protein